jgi:tRNA-specific 2-thiouridylase
VIGEHKGLVHHTVGQRRGIGIASPQPLYVLNIDTAKNRLMVGSRTRAVARQVEADGVAFTSGIWPGAPVTCQAMVRYRGQLSDALVTPGAPGGGAATIRFTGEAAGLPIASPGQAIVFYDGDQVLGGGTIRAVERATEDGGADGATG